jgi:Flp pilus assembly protein TadB
VCIEAGSSLDQAIVKASDELEITHPPLAQEMRMITTEISAGKPRLEAFTNFAQRTKVPDVRSLVTMLTQTDRFGTSVSQALRIHADTSRTKRRQRAEERAAKIGVKLVFPWCCVSSRRSTSCASAPQSLRSTAVCSSSRRLLVSVTRLEVVMLNIAMMAVLGVLVVVYVLRRKSRLNDDV